MNIREVAENLLRPRTICLLGIGCDCRIVSTKVWREELASCEELIFPARDLCNGHDAARAWSNSLQRLTIKRKATDWTVLLDSS